MVKNDSPLVSVVVPVYNVGKYLDECLESIVNQTYSSIEIILIDDNSSDESGNMCDEWAKKDKRIRVIHKSKNEGLFQARITGLEAMSGSYFTLVDSDDYIGVDFISKLLDIGLKSAADIVIENTFIPVDEHGGEGGVVEMPKIQTPTDVFDGFMKNLSKENWGWCVWAKLYKSSIYHNSQKYLLPVDKRINAAEDVLFSTVFASFAEKTVYIDTYTGYYYRQNSTSITRLASNEASINRLVSISDALFEMKDFMLNLQVFGSYEKKFYQFKKHLLSNYVWSLHNDYMKIISNIETQKNDLESANLKITADNSALKLQNTEILSSKTYKAGKLIALPYNRLRRMLK